MNISERGIDEDFKLIDVSNMPNETEINTLLTYGDYYLVETMFRYYFYSKKAI